MKLLLIYFLFIFSLSTIASSKMMVCHDVEFGAGHLKIIIPKTAGFFAPREQKPMVKATFVVKGELYSGVLENALFMSDWGANSGWYRSSPSPLDFSLCNWKKCPVRKIKLMVHTKDQLKAEGNVRFLLQTSEKERVKFDRKLNCELR